MREPLECRHDGHGLDHVEERPRADRHGVVSGEQRGEAVDDCGESVCDGRKADLGGKTDKLCFMFLDFFWRD